MNQLIYRLMYWLGQAHWDSGQTPPEVLDTLARLESKPGCALDLGCGTGTNSVTLAQHGWQVIGIDFVPEAVRKAQAKAERAGVAAQVRFITGDVTRLRDLNLSMCSLALDVGCFHGLGEQSQQRYAEDLAALMLPGGQFLLYVLDPRREAGLAFGLLAEQVQTIFAPWFEVERIERSPSPKPGSSWIWLRRCTQ